ncbi:hypothetical protein VNI00_006464 [Paramarasmius palmivorus]|uniref:Uncharacterized protein n=1 Tax=Paramarasmius palmivorus TaxID=297713 RepID=A0AAW0D9T7_9AGAR
MWPKVLKQYTGDRLTIDLYINTVDLVAMCLQNSFLGPMWISQALEAGFIQAVFKTFRLKVMGTDSDDSRPWQPLDGALMQIALYMVYPSVLHRFMGYMKVDGCVEVDVAQLALVDNVAELLSTSCRAQGHGWSDGKGTSELLLQGDGSPPPNHIDLHFFTTLVRIYTFRAGEILLEAIQSPGSSMHSTLQIPGLGDEVDLSPKIVVFELSDWDPERNALFSPAPTPSLTDLNTLTREIGIETELGRRIFPELFSAVKKARKVDFVVLSFFPGIIGRPEKDGWPVVSTLCLPISTEAQTTDSDQEEGSSGYEASRESDGLEEATDDEEEEDSEYNSGEDSDDSEDSGEHIDSYE